MVSYQARQLLVNIAYLYQSEQEAFSKQDITKRIGRIKYLSAQKKVPKLTLRKEIIHLENKLQRIFEVEKALLYQKRKESVKISSLKRQLTNLKKRLVASEDKDLQKKVDKFSNLLGDYLAQKDSKEDAKLSEVMAAKKRVKPTVTVPVARKEILSKDAIDQVKSLQRRLMALKHELAITKELEKKDPQKIKLVGMNINLLETKLNQFTSKYPEVLRHLVVEGKRPQVVEAETKVGKEKIKHTMLFEQPKILDKKIVQLEKELPLPPPPRMSG